MNNLVKCLPRSAFILPWLIAIPFSAHAQTCDKACLSGMLKDYETRVLAHDAKALPTTADFRMTENYKPIKPGEGYWTTIGKIYYELIFADAVTGQIAAVGMLDHAGRNAYYALRLKVDHQKISQSEMFLVHKGDASFFEESVAKRIDPIYETAVPLKQRSTREQLIKIADAFTDSWQYRNEDLAPYADHCVFYENNVKLTEPNGPAGDTCGGMVEYGGKNGIAGAGKAGKTNAPRPGGQVAGAGGEPDNAFGPPRTQRLADSSIGLPALFGTQMFMRDRRYPIVDVQRGVVYAYQIQGGTPARPGEKIVYDGAMPAMPPAGQGTPPGQPGAGGPPASGSAVAPPPNMMMAGAAYMVALIKIVDGKIVRVDHFEREGGPNASGGFADGPAH